MENQKEPVSAVNQKQKTKQKKKKGKFKHPKQVRDFWKNEKRKQRAKKKGK